MFARHERLVLWEINSDSVRRMDSMPVVEEFFRDREIFVTGGTGFLGKVFIEKLLYSCSSLKTIFVLIRPKKGVKPEDRLKKFIEDSVSEILGIFFLVGTTKSSFFPFKSLIKEMFTKVTGVLPIITSKMCLCEAY